MEDTQSHTINEGKSKFKKKPSYDQPTVVVKDDDVDQAGGKEALFEELHRKNLVAFPDREQKSPEPFADSSNLSRIEQLR